MLNHGDEYQRFYEQARRAWKRYEVAQDEVDRTRKAFEQAREAGVASKRLAEMDSEYEAAWRQRCLASLYHDLAMVRVYITEFGFDVPGVVIPDTVFQQ